jgi:hypothetical protein
MRSRTFFHHRPEADTETVEQYDIRLRGLTSKGKGLVRDYGAVWTVVNTNGPNVVVASPVQEPTYWRILMEVGDPNFEVERLDR